MNPKHEVIGKRWAHLKSAKWKEKCKFWWSLQAKDTASDLLAFFEAFLGVGVLLLALDEGHVLCLAFERYVPRRRHQHRRCWDRISSSIHSARHSQNSIFLLMGNKNRKFHHLINNLFRLVSEKVNETSKQTVIGTHTNATTFTVNDFPGKQTENYR